MTPKYNLLIQHLFINAHNAIQPTVRALQQPSSNRPYMHDRFIIILARDSMLSELYAIARPSVCLPVTRVDQSKTVEVKAAGGCILWSVQLRLSASS